MVIQWRFGWQHRTRQPLAWSVLGRQFCGEPTINVVRNGYCTDKRKIVRCLGQLPEQFVVQRLPVVVSIGCPPHALRRVRYVKAAGLSAEGSKGYKYPVANIHVEQGRIVLVWDMHTPQADESPWFYGLSWDYLPWHEKKVNMPRNKSHACQSLLTHMLTAYLMSFVLYAAVGC
eukprot:6211290-Pleurochrysis_carterae.AAC.2